MLKKLLLAAAGLALAAPALADGWHRGHYKPRYEPRHVRHYHPPVVVYRPAPVVYHYRPYYYYHPAPVAYPVAPGLSLSFTIPLR